MHLGHMRPLLHAYCNLVFHCSWPVEGRKMHGSVKAILSREAGSSAMGRVAASDAL
jgi:hypothetical protein